MTLVFETPRLILRYVCRQAVDTLADVLDGLVVRAAFATEPFDRRLMEA